MITYHTIKNILQNGLLLLISLVIAFTILESGLRLYYYKSLAGPDFRYEAGLREPHPTRGWTLAPNKSALQQTLDYTQFSVQLTRGGTLNIKVD